MNFGAHEALSDNVAFKKENLQMKKAGVYFFQTGGSQLVVAKRPTWHDSQENVINNRPKPGWKHTHVAKPISNGTWNKPDCRIRQHRKKLFESEKNFRLSERRKRRWSCRTIFTLTYIIGDDGTENLSGLYQTGFRHKFDWFLWGEDFGIW